jgi:fructose-specific phosphotransferase system IIC component
MGFAQVRKAALAAGLGFVIALAAAYKQKGSVDQSDVVAAVVAGVLAGVSVYYVKNAPVVAKTP